MKTGFEYEIQDPHRSVVVDMAYPGAPVLLAFGGIAGRMAAMPPFEFFRLTHRLAVNKVYLRDLDQCWYHAGLRGVTRDITGTLAFLTSLVSECRTDTAVVVGSSMGGYAALLFGSLMQASAIHAFSPHVFLGDGRSIRNKERLRALHENFSDEYWDLNGVLEPPQRPGGRHIYFDSTNGKDRRQVKHLEDHPHLRLHRFRGGGHNLVKYLKASGELEKVVTSSLRNVSYEPRRDIPLRRPLLDRILGRRLP